LIERLRNHPNIMRGTAGATLLGALAAGGVYKANAASNHEASTAVTQEDSQRAHDENMLFIHDVRASLVREAQLQAARDAHRQHLIEQAIPTPYSGPLPIESLSSSPTSSPTTPKPTERFSASPTPTAIELPAIAGQYFFGTGKAAQKFAKLGAHAHQIAQLEYNLGKQNGMSNTVIGCEQSLTVMESGNTETATNVISGAYGLPQALPGKKMASAGGDWRTNPTTQLAWMDGYADARYGGLCEAWAYWQNHSSY